MRSQMCRHELLGAESERGMGSLELPAAPWSYKRTVSWSFSVNRLSAFWVLLVLVLISHLAKSDATLLTLSQLSYGI